MAYKIRHKKEKRCPACDQRFYGYANQKFCTPKHGRIFWRYGRIENTPKAIKAYEKRWEERKRLSIEAKLNGTIIEER